MSHPTDPDELLKVLGNKLRSVVRDDPWMGLRIFLSRPLQDHLHLRFRHRLSDVPMYDVPAAPGACSFRWIFSESAC